MALTIDYVLDPAAVSATLERVVNKTFDFGVVADDVVDLVTSETMHVYSDGVQRGRTPPTDMQNWFRFWNHLINPDVVRG